MAYVNLGPEAGGNHPPRLAEQAVEIGREVVKKVFFHVQGEPTLSNHSQLNVVKQSEIGSETTPQLF